MFKSENHTLTGSRGCMDSSKWRRTFNRIKTECYINNEKEIDNIENQMNADSETEIDNIEHEMNDDSEKAMEAAWNAAYLETTDEETNWKNVRGPAGAVAASLGELNWTARSFSEWTTDMDVVINLQYIRPALVEILVEEAVQRKLWHESTLAEKDQNGKDEVDWERERDAMVVPDTRSGAWRRQANWCRGEIGSNRNAMAPV